MTLLSTAADSSAPEPLWDVAAAGRFLRKSKRWLYGALAIPKDRKGSIPHYRVGASPRFCPGELRQWVVRGCPPADDIQGKG